MRLLCEIIRIWYFILKYYVRLHLNGYLLLFYQKLVKRLFIFYRYFISVLKYFRILYHYTITFYSEQMIIIYNCHSHVFHSSSNKYHINCISIITFFIIDCIVYTVKRKYLAFLSLLNMCIKLIKAVHFLQQYISFF